MLRLVFLATCLALCASASATDLVLKNPDFENAMVGERIPGWSRTQHAGVRAYEVTNDAKSFDKGKSSIRMLRTTEQFYGLIMQQLETPNLAGKTVELIAALKGEDVGEKGWVMVLMFKNYSTLIEEVRAAPITGDAEWTDVKITKIAPPGTTHIGVGFTLLDGGAGWVDNVRLRTLDEDRPGKDDNVTEALPDETPASDKPESVKPASEQKSAPSKGDS